MSVDLQLKSSCSECGSTTDLYGSNCKHMTLCLNCGKTMAENRRKCFDCGVTITRLIREYNVRASPSSDKNYFIGRFVTGLPIFSKKKNAENKWSIHKEGLQGRQLTDALREKFKNKPWLLEDETGQYQYHGHLEGSQSATYYLLILQGKEFVAIPAASWYNFNKVAQYKMLTLEEAEEKMKNRRKTADGYERWMMKAANNGPAAFGEMEKPDDKDVRTTSGRGRRKTAGDDDDEGKISDKGEEDEEEEMSRKNRLGLNRQGGGDDDEGPRGGDHDMDDDDVEKGDDWEHEEIFTDDDEAVGNDPEERQDLGPELPAPPEIKQDEDDEDEENEEGGLSKSGKELKALLGRSGGLDDTDAEDDDDDDMDEDTGLSPVLAQKQKDAPIKEEPGDNSPAKPMHSSSAKGALSASKSAKGKRKTNGDDGKTSNVSPQKKVKTENESKHIVKEENVPTSKSKSSANPKGAAASLRTESTSSTGFVTDEEIKAVLLQNGPVTTQDLVAKFKSRLKTREDKEAFTHTLKRISRIQKTSGGSYVVLRDK
ncbi:transcription initiation factor IIF subunit alpha [Ricinus communis]|uniref:transcription initiation factor IIF subunit alpha n=1 Tax=Ricinus communis TaxID=3988 RepID=UPI000772D287|nr:transcription initiation factor IIF subunit alpha [Ricinus communis]|eukprot:XP_015581132.1 transcription initiation factor IIF subunit alpha [Ricinus communis]